MLDEVMKKRRSRYYEGTERNRDSQPPFLEACSRYVSGLGPAKQAICLNRIGAARWPIRRRNLARDVIPDRGLVTDAGHPPLNIKSIMMSSPPYCFQMQMIEFEKDERICEGVRESIQTLCSPWQVILSKPTDFRDADATKESDDYCWSRTELSNS